MDPHADTTQDAWQRLKTVVGDALDLPKDAREAYVRDRLAGDESLTAEALGLITGDTGDEAPAVLHRQADAFLGMGGPDPSGLAGHTLGHGKYRLERLIGEGAMSAVYLARQEGVERPVAIKAMRPRALGYDAKRRFAREVEALGRLEHAGIAGILEAGVEDETPWLAMEHVDGPTLIDFAQTRQLAVRGRIELLAKVADAVHAAHQRGVVHRDLKPANVLVDGSGQPKVLDFGIARVLDEANERDGAGDIAHTTTGMLMGTLGYMAPEQARGNGAAVDVRGDVYALGVMLHELVTGRLPVPVDGLPVTEALRRLSDPDITPRSIGTIHDDPTGGDLAIVAARALSSEPARRYPSAEAMADDLRRLLKHEQIRARPPTLLYAARKFTRRHRTGAAAASLILAALLLGGTAATFGFVREAQARETAEAALASANQALAFAEQQHQRQEAARRFLSRILEQADPSYGGANVTVLGALRLAEPLIPAFASNRPMIESDLRLDLARALRGAGAYEEAVQQYELAEAAAMRVVGEAAWAPIETATERASLLADAGDAEAGRQTLETARAAWEQLTEDERGPYAERVLVQFDATEADVLFSEGQWLMAAELWDELLPRVDAVAAEPVSAGQTTAMEKLTADEADRYRANAAIVYANVGRYTEAASLHGRVLEAVERQLGSNAPSLVVARINLATSLTELGELDEALQQARRAEADSERLIGMQSPQYRSARRAVASVLGKRHGVPEALRESAEIYGDVAEAEAAAVADGTGDAMLVILSRNNAAATLATLGDFEAAALAYEQVLEPLRDLVDETHPMMLTVRANLAQMLEQSGQTDEAIRELVEVLRLQSEVLGATSDSTLITRNNLAMICLKAGDADRAESELAACLSIAEAAGYGSIIPILRRNYGRALTGAGKHDEAITQLTRAAEEAQPLGPAAVERTTMFLREAEDAARPATRPAP